MALTENVQEHCIGLLNSDRGIRQNSASALQELGEEAIPALENIIISQDESSGKDWPLLVGAVSTLNLLGVSEVPTVAKYQKDLLWLPEDKGRYDLHVHTQLSDGTQTVEEVIQGAVKACAKVISLCDHNTMDGVSLAQRLGRDYGVRVMPGCEFSTHMDIGDTTQNWIEVHIAGYFMDPVKSEDLMMSTQLRIQMRDILIANDFLNENAQKLTELYGQPKDIIDTILDANRYYCEILRRNSVHNKADYVESVIREVEADKETYKKRLDQLIRNASASPTFYEYKADEESLLKKLVLFSGYMIDHAMNVLYDEITGEEFKGGNWFSEIKKRQERYVRCLPKIDPETVVKGIYELGGVPIVSHPTWYSVLYLQKSRRRIREQEARDPTEDEEMQLREMALKKGIEVVRRMHACMPDGLQVMEVYHWSHDTEFELEPHFRRLAEELGASLSAASDFHGPKKYGEHRSRIATGVNFNILGTYEQVQALEGLRRDG